ncbi:unnamed protein product [Orchesella dallaii]|uniref:Uncharacterized protein n=1 Tax=Orchesella dallaii TaxID=48710 RepID=A0ABP1PXX0_9HEXA
MPNKGKGTNHQSKITEEILILKRDILIKEQEKEELNQRLSKKEAELAVIKFAQFQREEEESKAIEEKERISILRESVRQEREEQYQRDLENFRTQVKNLKERLQISLQERFQADSERREALRTIRSLREELEAFKSENRTLKAQLINYPSLHNFIPGLPPINHSLSQAALDALERYPENLHIGESQPFAARRSESTCCIFSLFRPRRQ